MTEATPSSATTGATFDDRFALVRERLLRICLGLVGADDAEDVVHDVYLRARSRHNQLRNADLFDAWMARTAINQCYNRHRGRARRLPDLFARKPPPEPDVGLRELVERLPARERTVVVLYIRARLSTRRDRGPRRHHPGQRPNDPLPRPPTPRRAAAGGEV